MTTSPGHDRFVRRGWEGFVTKEIDDDIRYRTEGLVKGFGKVRALDGIDMVAREGTVFGLLGPNGAGKTTAIRVLSAAPAGIGAGPRSAVRQYNAIEEVRRLIGLTEQYAAVDELLSGKENLFMIGRLLGVRAVEARRRATSCWRRSIWPTLPRNS